MDRERVLRQIRTNLFGAKPAPVTVADRYTIVERLGRGTSGEVFRAYDTELDREIALKLVVLDSTHADTKRRERLYREARALARLSHPHVVQVYDVGSQGDTLYIAMELIDGHSLDRWQRDNTPGYKEILAVYAEAGRGLSAAHRLGIIHKDFKPSNVVISEGDHRRICVADFGIAQMLREESVPTEDGSGQAPPGQDPTWTVGFTPAYAAPEQMAASAAATEPRSDQYAFCSSLFEALFGKLPFEGGTTDEIRRNKEAGHVCPFSGGEVPRKVIRAVLRGLSPAPADRFASMDELLQALKPRRAPTRAIAGVGMLAVATAVAARWMAPTPAVDPCEAYTDRPASIWNDQSRTAVRAAVTKETDLALAGIGRFDTDVSRYLDQWSTAAFAACQQQASPGSPTDRPPEPSGQLSCLEQRWLAVDGLIARLEAPGNTLMERAARLVHDLPLIDECEQRHWEEIPKDAEQRLMSQLGRAHAAVVAHQWTEAFEQARAARVIAAEHGQTQREVEAALVMGRAALGKDDVEQGIQLLEEAAVRAESVRDLRLAWRGWTTLVEDGVARRRPPKDLAGWVASAQSAARVLGDDPLRMVHIEVARASTSLVDPRQSRTVLEAAWKQLQALDQDDPWVQELQRSTAMSLAMRAAPSAGPEATVTWAEEALRLADARLSPLHPDVVMARLNLGYGLLATCQLDAARQLLEAAATDAATVWSSPPQPERARIHLALAQLALQEGDATKASSELDLVDGMLAQDDRQLRMLLRINRATVMFARGALEAAANAYDEAAVALTDNGDALNAALARANAAECRLHVGDPSGAATVAHDVIEEIEALAGADGARYATVALKVEGLATLHDNPARAVELLQRALADVPECEYLERADIQLGLGTALIAQGKKGEGRVLQDKAIANYGNVGELGEFRQALMRRWLHRE
ncbi:MAG: serine/threonine protein kinase [Deltaproteobacteria bacterium]|nr:serine/threonine protein kinase [Deltaproteobacteria bacterium]